MKRLTILLTVAVLAGTSACTNPFAPEKETGPGEVSEPIPPATTPEQLIDNLRRVMRDRDAEEYEKLLDQDFWFTETDCLGDLVFANGLEEELEIMSGSRDGSRPGIFDIYRDFSFDFQLIRRSVELGSEYPEAYPGDPDGHPDEDWEVFRGNVNMEMVDENGDGFRVDQIMTYKLRLGGDGLYRMIRWVDDPLAGDCDAGTAKLLGNRTRWGTIKQAHR